MASVDAKRQRSSDHWPRCFLALLAVAVAGCAPASHEPRASGTPSAAAVAEEAERHCERAARLFYEQNIAAAADELERALELRPDHAEAHRLLGLLLVGQRQLGPAARHLRRAVALEPSLHAAKAELGAIYLGEHRWQEAAALFSVVAGEPSFDGRPLAHARLGWALHNLGRYEEAAEHFRMAIYLDASSCRNYGHLGLAYEGMGDRLLALDAWEQAVRHCPGDPEPFFHLGRLLALAGDTARASAAFHRCQSLEPSSPFGRRCAAQHM